MKDSEISLEYQVFGTPLNHGIGKSVFPETLDKR